MDFLNKMKNALPLAATIIALCATSAFAQLSPGDLSKPHSFLEGLDNCNKCHGFERQISSNKCLACHTLMGERIKAGKGLHANSDYKQCELCHVEHLGKDYELIFWKGGQGKFDHAQTGYRLEGKHTQAECRACHRWKNIVEKDRLQELKKDLNRTYMGLKQECLTCHHDEHRGQLADCQGCHSYAAWKPVREFDHNKAKFALTGKHLSLTCEKCHLAVADNKFENDKEYVKFKGLQYERCLDCHKDAHNNKFGQNCEGCHNTTGWGSVNRTDFDHGKTKFALIGKHAIIACDKCHLPGKSFKQMKFEKCMDCHNDYHNGQFAARQGKGACEECHTVSGFTPTKFTLAQHQKSKYPLEGSHLAVPCISCHLKTTLENGAEFVRFRFENTKCLTCHANPHEKQVDKYLSKGGCEFCHAVDGWRKVSFDHASTKLPLEARHKEISCGKCHEKSTSGKRTLKFAELPLRCQDCHEDIHVRQFASMEKTAPGKPMETDCARCHTSNSWTAEKFDHNRDSQFKLDGAHLKVSCRSCHKETTVDGKRYIPFKPMSMVCNSCHGGKIPDDGGKKS
jgi:hypothetical protein